MEQLTLSAMIHLVQNGLKKNSAPKKVVIIGAGMAGLVSASLLKQAGHHVTVIEADSRIGGRVFTVREPFSNGLSFEAGAARIPSNHYLTWEFIRKFNLSTYPIITSTPNDLFYIHGIQTKRRFYEENPDMFNFKLANHEKEKTAIELLKEIALTIVPYLTRYSAPSKLIEQLNNYTLDTFLQNPPLNNPLSPGAIDKIKVILAMQGFSEYSAFHILQILWPWFDDQISFHAIEGGNDQLPHQLYSQVKNEIYLNERVIRIDAKQEEITIFSSNTVSSNITTLKADKVILAIPFSSLKMVDINPRVLFTNEKWQAIRELRYVPLSRIGIEFKKRFWEEQGYYGGQTITDLPMRYTFLPSQGLGSPGPAIITASYTLGADTLPWEAMSNTDRLAFILQQLTTLYGEVVYKEYVSAVAVNWRQHPFIQGGFGVLKAGDVRQFAQHLSTPEHHFHFAGEHTSSHPGWIEGAVESGVRAAYEVHQS
ncbi:flavin monoamine oxidase family protein [Anaerobacillus alkaliphilus]|nr:flavin monoamine oxidase family protein [Anaerobacillus alkaliphilus]